MSAVVAGSDQPGLTVNPDLLTVFVGLLAIIVPLCIRIKYNRVKYQGQSRKWQTVVFHNLEIKINNDVVLSLKQGHTPLQGHAPVFQANIARSIPQDAECVVSRVEDGIVLEFEGLATLTVRHTGEGESHQYLFEWKVIGHKVDHLEESIKMLGHHWYGLGHVWNHPWPMERWDVKMSPVISGELEPLKKGEWFGGIQERLWLMSSGVALFVDFNSPLFASVNHNSDGKLRLVARNVSPYQEDELSLKYTLLQEKDVKAAYLSAVGKAFEKAKSVPCEKMFRHPVWSTWAQYKQDITQDRVIEFAQNIRKHGFKDSQLEIDDDWTPAYGDWTFNAAKFPDPVRMVQALKELGFRVTIWMHPFANVDSEAIKEKQYWIQDPSTGKPSIVRWWNGQAALLDVTNPSSKSWLKSKCQNLRQIGIDSFKFDAGEALYLPDQRKMHKTLKSPNAYNKLFVDLCLELDPEMRAIEVRSGVASQHVPMFFRVNDKDSNWSTVNGLKTVIPHVLNQGLLGYPFVLPDMIGGNAYSMVGFSKTSKFPGRELFIRWMQVNALMPAMQFSVVPWRYDDEVVHIAHKMCELHEKYADLILELAHEATLTGAPICRPLWWIAPHDETALTISTEFLLGSEVLVAPVLEEGATSRDVYLPEGRWRDEISGRELQGAAWIRDHPADLDQLPYFTKIQ